MDKKLVSFIVTVALLIGLLAVAMLDIPMGEKRGGNDTEELLTETVHDKESIYLWYTDENLTNFLNAAAVTYNEENNTRIVPMLQSPIQYLEAVNKSTIENDSPDIYIISHDSLGRAYMAGLAKPIEMAPAEYDNIYKSPARNAVTYKDMMLGYPLNFETGALLYNKTYLESMAVTALDRIAIETAVSEGIQKTADTPATPSPTLTPTPKPSPSESAKPTSNAPTPKPTATPTPTATPEPTPTPTPIPYTQEEINAKLKELLPLTMDDITNLADSYDAPEGVESFINWDVNDVFFNYFFIGDAIDVGGEAGWDTSIIDIYNENAISSLEAYQNMNQFFSISTDECDYEKVIQDFMDGKIIFTIATTDAISRLEQAKADGSFNYEYGVCMIPDMTEELETKSMSVTNAVAVNPFSNHMEAAEEFARFLTTEYAAELYQRSGKLPVTKSVKYDLDEFNIYVDEYNYSAPIPKMMETSNFWVELEAVFADVWDGDDANDRLKALAEDMIFRVTGEKTSLPHIEVVKEEEEIEYFDEEELTREAQNEE